MTKTKTKKTPTKPGTPAVDTVILQLAVAAGSLANYCDHAEHCEAVKREWATGAAWMFRRTASELARSLEVDLKVWLEVSVPEDSDFSRDFFDVDVETWRELQLALVGFDRAESPDVVGMSRYDQLRHHALKAAVLVGDIADRGFTDPVPVRALMLGLRISTVMHERLGDEAHGLW